ncbi:MAG: hypothetical protein V9G19_10345 [Tetrasphaera sp.]
MVPKRGGSKKKSARNTTSSQQRAKQSRREVSRSTRDPQATTSARGEPIVAADSASSTYAYVDIAGVRIQSWLARTPKLAARRGASVALASLTSERYVTEVLTRLAVHYPTDCATVEWNPEAGEISGVISLRMSAQLGPPPESAIRVAAAVAEGLRSTLPALPLSVTVTTASSYVDAYAESPTSPNPKLRLVDVANS